MTAPGVHVVVVAYHAADQLDVCLAAIAHELPVIVVDNSSSADVRAATERHRATYVDAGGNRGFATGVNIALRRLAAGEAQDVLLLNPDAVVDPSAVAALAACLARPGCERVAAVAPRLFDPNGVEQRVVWPFPSPLRACMEAIGLGRLPARRSFAIGAVLLLRGEAVREIGPFDERFFLYGEETDWQRRARDRGWTSSLCAAAVARHVGAGTSENARRRELLFHAAQETYIRKWHGPAGWWVYRVASCAGAAARALVLTRERRRAAQRRVLLYLRGPRRCAAAELD